MGLPENVHGLVIVLPPRHKPVRQWARCVRLGAGHPARQAQDVTPSGGGFQNAPVQSLVVTCHPLQGKLLFGCGAALGAVDVPYSADRGDHVGLILAQKPVFPSLTISGAAP